MGDFVYVRVSDLEKLVLDMKRHQLDVACVSIEDAYEEEGEQVPPSLCVSGANSVRPGFAIDMDELFSDPSLESRFSEGVSHASMT